MRSCMAEKRTHLKKNANKGCRTGRAVEMINSAWSALSNSLVLGSFQNGYFPYFLYGDKTTLLQVLISRSDSFSPLSQQRSLAEVRGP